MKRLLWYIDLTSLSVACAPAQIATVFRRLQSKTDEKQITTVNRLKFALLTGVVILVTTYLPCYGLQGQTTATAPVINEMERPIHACEQQVKQWESEEHTEIAMVIVVIALGVIISGLQGSSARWAKVTTLCLGMVTAILAGINPRIFTADDRTLKRAAFEGETIINKLWIIMDTLKDVNLTAQDRVTAKGEYLKKLEEFQKIGERLNGTMNDSASSNNGDKSIGLLTSVYAQSRAAVPVWVQKPPADNTSLYFIGTAYDNSLTIAKQDSLDNTYHNAATALKLQIPNASDTSLITLIKASAVIQDTAFTYDQSAKKYTYYTLIRLSKEIQSVAESLPLSDLPQTKFTIFEAKGWRPEDLAFNSNSGMFVLDATGAVSRVAVDQQGVPHIEKLFKLDLDISGNALAADAQSVFVTSTAVPGCTIYRYSLVTKTLSRRRLFSPDESCVGIASDGKSVYLTVPSRGEIRYFESWDASSSHSLSFSTITHPSILAFDNVGYRLIVYSNGSVYAISLPDHKRQLLASDLEDVSFISASRFYVLLASGKRIIFLARSDNHRENPPAILQSLKKGEIAGIVIDPNDQLWIADSDRKLVTGPFLLN